MDEAPGWYPLDGPPRTDAEWLEALTAAVFQARFRPELVRARWPAIRAAFANFDVEAVASLPDEAVARLREAPGVIRNDKKLRATLRNARALGRLAREAGSVSAWIAALPPGEARVQAVDAWAHYVGAPSIRWLLRAAGALSSAARPAEARPRRGRPARGPRA